MNFHEIRLTPINFHEIPLTPINFHETPLNPINFHEIPLNSINWLVRLDASVCRLQVECYGRGRVFLAGDACHCHSPLGGQGIEWRG